MNSSEHLAPLLAPDEYDVDDPISSANNVDDMAADDDDEMLDEIDDEAQEDEDDGAEGELPPHPPV